MGQSTAQLSSSSSWTVSQAAMMMVEQQEPLATYRFRRLVLQIIAALDVILRSYDAKLLEHIIGRKHGARKM